MSTTETILAILSSSVLSAMLTSYFNWRIHNSNYKKDYYKKILDKRLDAYESLNALTKTLSSIVYFEQGFVHGIVSSTTSFEHFMFTFHSTLEKSHWFADRTTHKLTEFGAFLFNEISGYIDDTLPEDDLNKIYKELAYIHFEKISQFNASLKEMVNTDLKNLHKVDDFFDKNGKNSKTYPLYEKEINKNQ